MRKRTLPSIFAALLIILSLGISLASALDDGSAAYDAKDYATAQRDFHQATQQTTGTEQAKAYYKLGLTYHKLKQDTQAVQAFQQAQKIDPSLSFASSPDKFQQNLARSQAAAGGLVQSPRASTPSFPRTATRELLAGDPASVALSASNVYVDPALQTVADPTKLEAAAQQNSHTLVKIAVLSHLPNGSGDVITYAGRLHKYLNLNRNGLIVVDAGPHGGVADVSTALTTDQESALAQKYVARIGAGDVSGGVTALAGDMASQINAGERFWPDVTLFIILVLIAIVAFVLYNQRRRTTAQLAYMRAPLEQLRQNVLDNIQYVDNYVDVLPKNNANSDQVRAYCQAAEAKYEQATKIMMKATDPSDLSRAQQVLDRAGADLNKARQYLDRATGGTSKIAGDSAIRPAPLPESQEQVNAVPQQQRGVSFFSSQPAPVTGLVPVTLTIDGVQRQVMATPQEAAEIQRGQIPPVRAFNVNGQNVPWYAYQEYDPYRDYWRYQNNGWGGFGGGVATGFIGAELLDTLFRPHYYGNYYSPYGYAPGFDSFGGWDSYDSNYDRGFMAGERENAGNYAFQDQYTQPPSDAAGGASFMGGSGYDTSDYGNQSGGGGGSSFLGGDRS